MGAIPVDTEKNCLSWGVKALTKRGARGKMPPTFSEEILELSRDLRFLQECPYIWHLEIWKHPFLHLPNSNVKNQHPSLFFFFFEKWNLKSNSFYSDIIS